LRWRGGGEDALPFDGTHENHSLMKKKIVCTPKNYIIIWIIIINIIIIKSLHVNIIKAKYYKIIIIAVIINK
jgi:hypothetical protein